MFLVKAISPREQGCENGQKSDEDQLEQFLDPGKLVMFSNRADGCQQIFR